MADSEESLPSLLAEFAEVVGRHNALKIASARGGTQIYLPAVPAADHWLSELIGHDQARKLCAEVAISGIRLEVPLGPAGQLNKLRASINVLIDDMLREGRSERDIAMTAGVNSRTVRRRRKMLRDGMNDA